MQKDLEGTVFSIEEFAINDGPGIRTTVFLKGCPLRCQWCHNPEGLSPVPQPMQRRDGTVTCGKLYTVDELVSKLLRNAEIFKMNKGGVTFTGGEPLLQAPFLTAVLSAIHPHVHCAIETSGYANENVFQRVLQHLDYVLFDLKQMDDNLHKRFTGVSNQPILRNLNLLKQSGIPFVIRIPLIPGVNDTREHLLAVRDAVSGAQHLVRVELLRYNELAGAKYPQVGMSYDPKFDVTRRPYVYDEILRSAGLNVIVL